MSPAQRPSLIVHGGAWSIPDDAVEACRAGCRHALELGWEILQGGGSALAAVEAAIVALEEDPTFDAGVGSHLNRDGRVELDAMIMDGATLGAGAVAAVERVRNPIRLARKVLEAGEHIMLVGRGAEEFAAEQGLPVCDPAELIIERERRAWERCRTGAHSLAFHEFGTVGAVAMDARGGLAAGTSTGGTCCKRPGRVGDSPLVGCGCYADSEAGGVSCTGWGEAIMRIVMAKTAADLLLRARSSDPSAQAAAPRTTAETCVRLLLERGQGRGGLILLDRDGRPGFAFNTPRMAYAYVASDGSFIASA